MKNSTPVSLLPNLLQNVREDFKNLKFKSHVSHLKSFLFSHYFLLFSLALVLGFGFLLERKKLPVFTVQVKESQKSVVTHNLNEGAESFRKNVKEMTGDWTLTRFGFGIKPGGKAILRTRVNKAPEQTAFVILWAYCPKPVENRITLETPAGRTVYANFQSEGQDSLPLGKIGEGQPWFDIIIEYKDPSGHMNPYVTLLDQISVATINHPYTTLPRMGGIFACAVLSFLLYSLSYSLGWNSFKSMIASLLSPIILFIQLSFLTIFWIPLIPLGIFLCAWIFIERKKTREGWEKVWDNPWITWGLMLSITVVGFLWRWEALGKVLFKDLPPDGKGFVSIAMNLSSPYATGMREPLFIWFLKFVDFFLPLMDLNVRIVSLTGSVLMIPLCFYTGKRLGGILTGIVASLFLATSGTLIDYCTEGLRLEWECVFLMLAAGVMICSPKSPGVFHGIITGLTIAFCSLLRTTLLYPLFVFALLMAVFRKWRLFFLIFLVLCAVLPLVPHLVNNAKQEGLGDPFYSINIHARYYRNQEFAGKPGFITREEYGKRAYSGTPVSTFQYMFRMHDFKTVMEWNWEGFVRIFFGFYMKGRIAPLWPFQYLFWLGMVLLLLRPWGRWIIIFMFLSVGGIVFLAGRPPALLLDYRLVIHIFPFVALCIGGGISIMVHELKKRLPVLMGKNHLKRDGTKAEKRRINKRRI